MTREEAEDNYRIKWEKQIKKDMADNSALRARQRPIRPLGASQAHSHSSGILTIDFYLQIVCIVYINFKFPN